MYLNRDVPNPEKQVPNEDEDPVEVDLLFRMHTHSALVIAQEKCNKLKEEGSPYKRSSIDFWCDMVDDLNQIEFDISLVE